MTAYRVRYLVPAQNDLIEILEYVRLDSPSAALELVGVIERGIGRLESFCNAGVVPKDGTIQRKKYRILVVGSYLVFYKAKGKTVWIHRVLHGKRKYGHLL